MIMSIDTVKYFVFPFSFIRLNIRSSNYIGSYRPLNENLNPLLNKHKNLPTCRDLIQPTYISFTPRFNIQLSTSSMAGRNAFPNQDSDSKKSRQVIDTAFSSLTRVVEAETDCTVASIDVLERINWNATKKYSQLADACQGLTTDKEYLADLSK